MPLPHRSLMKLVVTVAALAAIGAGTPAVRWLAPVAVATGGGEKGPWRQNDSRYDYVDDATVAFGPNGDIHVAWVNQGQKDVLFQSFGADGRPRLLPVNVSNNPATFSWLPRIATLPGDPGKVFVLWQEIIFSGGTHGGDILFARSSDGGASFSIPLNLSDSAGGDGKGRIDRDTWSNGSLDLAVLAGGIVLAAWTEYHGALWLARSTDGGASFSMPRRLAGDDARPARGPSLAAGPGKTVYLAWTVGEDKDADIRAAQSDDGGATFGKPHLIGPGPGYADAPRLVADGRDRLHLVYAQGLQVRYAQSKNGAAGFGPPRALPHTDGASAAYPALDVDGEGNIFVSWEVFSQRGYPRGLAYTFSPDGGSSFAAPAPVPASRDARGGTNGSHQGLLGKKLDVGAHGRIAIVNSSLDEGAGSRVWLMRGQISPRP